MDQGSDGMARHWWVTVAVVGVVVRHTPTSIQSDRQRGETEATPHHEREW